MSSVAKLIDALRLVREARAECLAEGYSVAVIDVVQRIELSRPIGSHTSRAGKTGVAVTRPPSKK